MRPVAEPRRRKAEGGAAPSPPNHGGPNPKASRSDARRFAAAHRVAGFFFGEGRPFQGGNGPLLQGAPAFPARQGPERQTPGLFSCAAEGSAPGRPTSIGPQVSLSARAALSSGKGPLLQGAPAFPARQGPERYAPGLFSCATEGSAPGRPPFRRRPSGRRFLFRRGPPFPGGKARFCKVRRPFRHAKARSAKPRAFFLARRKAARPVAESRRRKAEGVALGRPPFRRRPSGRRFLFRQGPLFPGGKARFCKVRRRFRHAKARSAKPRAFFLARRKAARPDACRFAAVHRAAGFSFDEGRPFQGGNGPLLQGTPAFPARQGPERQAPGLFSCAAEGGAPRRRITEEKGGRRRARTPAVSPPSIGPQVSLSTGAALSRGKGPLLQGTPAFPARQGPERQAPGLFSCAAEGGARPRPAGRCSSGCPGTALPRRFVGSPRC